MSETTDLYIKMDSDLKYDAEKILRTLGISPTEAVTMFYKQIVIKGGMPFEIKVPELRPLTEEEFNAALEEGYQEYLEGKGIPFEEAVKMMGVDLEELKKERWEE